MLFLLEKVLHRFAAFAYFAVAIFFIWFSSFSFSFSSSFFISFFIFTCCLLLCNIVMK